MSSRPKRPREPPLQLGPLLQHFCTTVLATRPVVRRGGFRQRRRAEPDELGDATQPGCSRISTGLLLDWCDGYISSSKLCFHLNRGFRDGTNCLLMDVLGCRGVDQHSNSHVVQFAKSLLLTNLVGTVSDPDEDWRSWVPPSELLQQISRNYPGEFERRLGANENDLQRFWTGFLGSSVGASIAGDHFFLRGKTPGTLRRVIPVTVFEDAGPYSHGGSCNCICFSAILGSGDERRCKYVVGVCVKLHGDGAVGHVIWNDVLTSFEKLCTDGFWTATISDGMCCQSSLKQTRMSGRMDGVIPLQFRRTIQ